MRCRFLSFPAIIFLLSLSPLAAWAEQAAPADPPSWEAALRQGMGAGAMACVERAMADFPDEELPLAIVADWLLQDGMASGPLQADRVAAVVESLGPAAGEMQKEAAEWKAQNVPATDPRWADLYLRACRQRRLARLQTVLRESPELIFTKHYDLGGSHYAYTEGQSDAQNERHFRPGTTLCKYRCDGLWGTVEPLVTDPQGVIRDPDVSYDGTRVLFAWKKSLDDDDYHLYEIGADGGDVRPITGGLGFADYEGVYLPNGDILFNSTRCVQIVDCWWTEVSNLYTCDRDGRYLRQVSFDQVHTNFPTVTADGRVVYTRWDYNDRGQIFPQGLFQMNQDGTGQTELYGNNSFFPTTILHTRHIPGTLKYVAIFTGHHSRQKGKLGIVDPSRGRQENQGTIEIAPVRETPAARIDAYGQQGDQFQYPYPLNENEFIVTYRLETQPLFGVYYMAADGARELLVRDRAISCNQPIPLRPRVVPILQPSRVDYRRDEGIIYLHNIYAGPGLAGIPSGTIKKLRVVALDFRAAGIGNNGNNGPAGGAMISTPISIQGAWDVKRVLGTVTVNDDGSACFRVPARTPIYFQALDEKNQMVQTMRSWMSLQPGEQVSCVGCHEHKNTSPPAETALTTAMRAGPQRIEPFYGPARGFSFIKEIQPILDRHCVRCHFDGEKRPTYAAAPAADSIAAQQLEKARPIVPVKGTPWRFTTEPPAAAWNQPDFDDSQWTYGPGGFGNPGTPGSAVKTDWNGTDIWLRHEFDLPEGLELKLPMLAIHHDEEAEVYLNGVIALNAPGILHDYTLAAINPAALKTLKPGRNTLAVHCHQTSGGQYIDVGLVDAAGDGPTGVAGDTTTPVPPDVKPAFSLRGIQTLDPQSQRKWSDSYVALADRRIADWVNVQSGPPMLPPYSAGASQSRLIRMLEIGHNGVKLSPEEMDKFIVWIDLLVPYVGDYTEAMNEEQIPNYEKFLDKRHAWQAEEAKNIERFLSERP